MADYYGAVNALKKAGYSDEEVAQIAKAKGMTPPEEEAGKSLGGFASNVGKDLGANLMGLLQLPAMAQKVSPYSAITSPIETAKTIGNVWKGIGTEYKDLITNPVETAYNKPISTIMDVLPFFQAGKAAMGGKASTAAKAGEIAKAGEVASKTSKLSGLTSKLGSNIETFGSELRLKGLRPTKTQMLQFKKAVGKDIVDFADTQKLKDLSFDSIESKLSTKMPELDKLTAKSNKVINKKQLVSRVDDAIKEIDIPEYKTIPEYQERIAYLEDFKKQIETNYADDIPISSLTKTRKAIDKVTNDFRNSGDSINASKNRLKGNIYRNIINDTAGTGQLGKDVSGLIKLSEIAEKQSYLGKGNIGVNAKQLWAGAAGGVPGLLLEKILESSKVQNALSSGIRKTGGAIKDISAPSVPKVSMPTGGLPTELATILSRASGQQGAGIEQASNAPQGVQAEQETTQPQMPPNEWTVNRTEKPSGMSKEALTILTMADPENADQYKMLYDLQNSASSGKSLPAGQVKDIADTDIAIDLLGSLKDDMGKYSSVIGPVTGNLAKLNPYSSKAQTFDALATQVKQIIGKGLEGGVLRKEDEYKYEQILPKITDTPKVIENKLELLNNTLARKKEITNQVYQQYGYSTGSDNTGTQTSDIDTLMQLLGQ